MLLFRLLLALLLLTILGYTAVVVMHHGMGFLPVFVGDIARFGWPGQFNLDFAGLLLLAGLWLAWRHGFGAGGMALGLGVLVGGTPLLCVYLLVQLARSGGTFARCWWARARARRPPPGPARKRGVAVHDCRVGCGSRWKVPPAARALCRSTACTTWPS